MVFGRKAKNVNGGAFPDPVKKLGKQLQKTDLLMIYESGEDMLDDDSLKSVCIFKFISQMREYDAKPVFKKNSVF